MPANLQTSQTSQTSPSTPVTHIQKWRASQTIPPSASLVHILWSGLGAAGVVTALGVLSDVVEQPLLVAPLGASAALIFAAPDSPLSQPRSVIGGHLVAAAVGLLVAALLGQGWLAHSLAAGLAVGLAVIFMLLTRTFHAPAGATPLVVLATQAAPSFLLVPILASTVTMVLLAYLYNNLVPKRSYPKYWW